ncbi:hypothetical protein EYB53_021770 [Candidatus Chloroploca sp. M-50]|uniref:Uncharacterized protein n=1 Tax=Candidatus Chloroploca mongolica TaxID=2528176 RepID=A0ABS4DFY9_9CHLR|nr:hypothetical protein [Candidatus Chloroploca mongolica]MBP1468355.1 hypothetical protein [Candidatus Chloroploca mongolica]
MEPLETRTHSFIVKIWREQTDEATKKALWRGYITHIPSGERRYVRRLADVTDVIQQYLDRLGVVQGWNWRARQWLRRTCLRR